METQLLGGLMQRKLYRVPTWRGWLVLFLFAITLFLAVLFNVYPFLALNDPQPGGILVVEGWGNEDAMNDALAEFHRNHYDGLFVTGGPIEKSSPLASYMTFAEFGTWVLVRLGGDPNRIHAVPGPEVVKDRTYASAVALRQWLADHHYAAAKVNVISMGAHCRRTRNLFQAAFGDSARVGIIASEGTDFDPRRWWTCSEGFRGVTGEIIAYLYALFLFHPPSA